MGFFRETFLESKQYGLSTVNRSTNHHHATMRPAMMNVSHFSSLPFSASRIATPTPTKRWNIVRTLKFIPHKKSS